MHLCLNIFLPTTQISLTHNDLYNFPNELILSENP